MLDMTAEDVIDFIKDFDLDKLGKCCSIKKLMFQKELTLIKQVYQKNWMPCHYWYFKDVGFRFEPHVCIKCHDPVMAADE